MGEPRIGDNPFQFNFELGAESPMGEFLKEGSVEGGIRLCANPNHSVGFCVNGGIGAPFHLSGGMALQLMGGSHHYHIHSVWGVGGVWETRSEILNPAYSACENYQDELATVRKLNKLKEKQEDKIPEPLPESYGCPGSQTFPSKTIEVDQGPLVPAGEAFTDTHLDWNFLGEESNFSARFLFEGNYRFSDQSAEIALLVGPRAKLWKGASLSLLAGAEFEISPGETRGEGLTLLLMDGLFDLIPAGDEH